MYTSVLLFALVGINPAPSEITEPSWLRSYDQARKEGQKASKPLAVFVGSGHHGFNQVSEDGQLSAEARRLLAKNYVCVYLNTDTPEGRRLAATLKIKDKSGVILSDRTGDYQAFNYPGTLRDDELTSCLKRFADPNLVVRTTVTSPYERISYYPPQTSTSTAPNTYGYGNALAQPYYPPINYGGFGGFGGFGGGGGC